MKAMIPNQSYTTELLGENTNTITIGDSQLNLKDYVTVK